MKITRVYYRIWIPDPKPTPRRTRRNSNYGTVRLGAVPTTKRQSDTVTVGRCLRLAVLVVAVPALLLVLLLYQRHRHSVTQTLHLAAADSLLVSAANLSTYWCQGLRFFGEQDFDVYQVDANATESSVVSFLVEDFSAVHLGETTTWSFFLPNKSTIFFLFQPREELNTTPPPPLLLLLMMERQKQNYSARYTGTTLPHGTPAAFSEEQLKHSPYYLPVEDTLTEPRSDSVLGTPPAEGDDNESVTATAQLYKLNKSSIRKCFQKTGQVEVCYPEANSTSLRYAVTSRQQYQFVVPTPDLGAEMVQLQILLQHSRLTADTDRAVCRERRRCLKPLAYGEKAPVLAVVQNVAKRSANISSWSRSHQVIVECVPRTSVHVMCLMAVIISLMIGGLLK